MDLDELPGAVRTRVLNLASRALSGATAAQIPKELVAVARFSPARRARRAAPALTRALQNDSAFRALVAHRAVSALAGRGGASAPQDRGPAPTLPSIAPSVSSDGSAGATQPDPAGIELPGPADTDQLLASVDSDVERLALAYLLGTSPPAGSLQRLDTAQELAGARSRIAELEAELAKAAAGSTEPRERSRTGSHQSSETADRSERSSTAGEAGELAARVERLTARLREQGTRLREAIDRAADLERQRDELESSSTRSLDASERGRAVAEQRVLALTAQWQGSEDDRRTRAARSEIRERAMTRRVEILLESAAASIVGLRAEWSGTRGAAGSGVDPADLIAERLSAPAQRQHPQVADTGRLADVLALPGVHVVVDGYNVSKSAFEHLTLAEQRDRLVRALGAVAVRTGAQITVVFDGAAVVAPSAAPRGVRVIFSPPGIIADDVIRDLVSAEPAGRPLLVVTSDRAVQRDVAAHGARVAASALLVAALAR